MTVPGADPNFPPYGVGDGRSPAAVGRAAFEVPPQHEIDIRTQTDPRFTRREKKANQEELGFAVPNMAGYNPGITAAVEPENYPETSPMPGADPDTNYGVTPPGDARTARATIRQ